MARRGFDGSTICGLVVASIIAPFIVAFDEVLPAAPGRLWNDLALDALGTVFAIPLSGIVTLAVGVPVILLARRLRIRAAWYVVGCGLAAGSMEVLMSGTVYVPDIVPFVASGLSAVSPSG